MDNINLFDCVNIRLFGNYLSISDLHSLSLTSYRGNCTAYNIIRQVHIHINSLNIDAIRTTPKHILNSLNIIKMVIGYDEYCNNTIINDISFEYLRYADTINVKHLVIHDDSARFYAHKFKSIETLQLVNVNNYITTPTKICIYENCHFSLYNYAPVLTRNYVFSYCTFDSDFPHEKFIDAYTYQFNNIKFVNLFKYLCESNEYKHTLPTRSSPYHKFIYV